MLTKLLDLKDYSVKNMTIKNEKIFLEIKKDNFPVCPNCNQSFLGTVKDCRVHKVEDLSVFGKRCILMVSKYRINCQCGYSGTEKIKWLNKYSRKTNRYCKWIYTFCKTMSCLDVSRLFGISKHSVYKIDKDGIGKELEEQDIIQPGKISIDEISRKKGHRYATIITAPKEKKVLDVVKNRKTEDLASFYVKMGHCWCENVKHVTMDAWLAFRKATKNHCKNATISFDHFHLAQHFSKAIDKLRVSEAKKAEVKNKGVFKGTRWLLLKRPENLKTDQKKSLDALLKLNEKLFITYILRDEFRQIFSGETSHARLIRFSNWIKKAQCANIHELNGFVSNIIKWEKYIKNALRTNSSNGFAEGINTKIRVIQRMAYGYKDFDYLRLKIIQQFNFKDSICLFES